MLGAQCSVLTIRRGPQHLTTSPPHATNEPRAMHQRPSPDPQALQGLTTSHVGEARASKVGCNVALSFRHCCGFRIAMQHLMRPTSTDNGHPSSLPVCDSPPTGARDPSTYRSLHVISWMPRCRCRCPPRCLGAHLGRCSTGELSDVLCMQTEIRSYSAPSLHQPRNPSMGPAPPFDWTCQTCR